MLEKLRKLIAISDRELKAYMRDESHETPTVSVALLEYGNRSHKWILIGYQSLAKTTSDFASLLAEIVTTKTTSD